MKETKKVIVTREVEELVKMRCDVCGAESRFSAWGKHRTEVEEVTVSIKIGSNYGQDGGCVNVTEFDICPKCFMEVIVRALEDLGAKARETQILY